MRNTEYFVGESQKILSGIVAGKNQHHILRLVFCRTNSPLQVDLYRVVCVNILYSQALGQTGPQQSLRD